MSLLILGLVGVVWIGHVYRRAFIRAFFVDGSGTAAAPVLAMPDAPVPALPPVDRVRVVLIDGLSESVAHGLPSLDGLCARGYDLRVDVGFPTVSLPVQYVLFTGLTQAQTGVLFRGKSGASAPAPGAIQLVPAMVPDSAAVAESHGYIVNALGFARAYPPWPENPDDPEFGAWDEDAFLDWARAQVTSESALVLVHILRVDVAGHRLGGRDSAAYRQAASDADGMLGALLAADAVAHPDGGTRWFVLADHGHRGRDGHAPGGGHGGATPEIRVVRGCVHDTGANSSPGGARTGYVHLVDVARTIADSLGVTLHPRSAGRPLAHALAAPVDPAATLPRPGPGRTVAGLCLVLLALVLTSVFARGQGLVALPWWWPVAVLSVSWLEAVPSLSHPMVFRALHPMVFVPALPGLGLLALQWALVARRGRGSSPLGPALSLLFGPLVLALACTVMAAGADTLAIAVWDLGLAAGIEPPLMPWYTGRASVLLALGYGGAFVSVLCLVVWRAAVGARELGGSRT